MNWLSPTYTDYQQEKHLKTGWVFLDWKLEYTIMDEIYSEENYKNLFLNLSIVDIFGEDIFEKDTKINLEKITAKYQLLTEFEVGDEINTSSLDLDPHTLTNYPVVEWSDGILYTRDKSGVYHSITQLHIDK